MDALSAVLEIIRHKGIVYEKIDFFAPWGIDLSGDQTAKFWRLVKGRCKIKPADAPVITLEEGDMVFIPHGTPHWIADSPDSHKTPIMQFLKAGDAGSHMFKGSGDRTLMIGGHFEFDDKPMHPFLKSLPEVIHVKDMDASVHNWLEMTGDLIFNELNQEQPGGNMMINRLADVVLIHVIRAYLQQAPGAGGFLLALKDERISSVLALMQNFPEKSWTIEQLCKQAAMSRSSFCTAFKKTVGEPPLEYLKIWRIIKAKEILIRETEKVSEVALRVGYQSEAAFSRAYKLMVGQSPSVFRQQNHA